ncbi:helix-turn-helix domain-containing protein [Streptomyces bambusae]|uniref:Helix-turn-helix domain-containing protein n=1 Tax=Streptomyces bambusae TaxID=1550616 RepID=A0ABS6ZEJ7_9ACTN|nr:helix-turn-helix domain-containing protein [Streptomyces bambusae]
MRHESHFTVVGNHLAQHPELSLMARGLALYIQSLPAGSPIGIKDLSGQLPEGEYRIGKALRELEVHGYLSRNRERLRSGQLVTRTFSYNAPRATCDDSPPEPPDDGGLDGDGPYEGGPYDAGLDGGGDCPPMAPDPAPHPDSDPAPAPDPHPAPAPDPTPEPEVLPSPSAPEAAQAPEGVQAPEGAQAPDEAARTLGQAWKLLAELRSSDPRLTLSVADIHRLAPDAARWLENGMRPSAVSRALTAGLPADLRYPAGILAYRLATQLPPPLPAPDPDPAPTPPPQPDMPPLLRIVDCQGPCGRVIRASEPGLCADCRIAQEQAVA